MMKRRSTGNQPRQQQARPNNHPKDDMIYCHGTARRAVARAALHLGIECMTAESVDVLASCLLDYLERIGAMMANNAEAGGRSSAHCNIYDAMHAIELCTCAAAATTTSSDVMNGVSQYETTDATEMGKINFNSGTSWKDLAAFCFGPNWNTDVSSTEGLLHPYDHSVNGGISNAAAGGKAGPMLMLNGSNASSVETGWNAPYPDELEHFPVVSKRGQVANPHPFPEPKLHRRDMNVESMLSDDSNEAEQTKAGLNDMPDFVFENETGWGEFTESITKQPSAHTGDKRSLKTTQDDESKPPAKKKVKMMDGSTATREHEHSHAFFEELQLPTFYPSIPTPQNDDNRIIVTDGKIPFDSRKVLPSFKTGATGAASTSSSANEATNQEWDHNNPTRSLVRSALLGRNLENSSGRNSSSSTSMFWGSSWSGATNRSIDLVVPSGRPTGSSATDGSTTGSTSTAGAATTALAAPSIVPISRASGSRVSRILEGSMDPPIQ